MHARTEELLKYDSEHVLHSLKAYYGVAELHALPGELQRLLIRALRNAEALRTNACP